MHVVYSITLTIPMGFGKEKAVKAVQAKENVSSSHLCILMNCWHHSNLKALTSCCFLHT